MRVGDYEVVGVGPAGAIFHVYARQNDPPS